MPKVVKSSGHSVQGSGAPVSLAQPKDRYYLLPLYRGDKASPESQAHVFFCWPANSKDSKGKAFRDALRAQSNCGPGVDCLQGWTVKHYMDLPNAPVGVKLHCILPGAAPAVVIAAPAPAAVIAAPAPAPAAVIAAPAPAPAAVIAAPAPAPAAVIAAPAPAVVIAAPAPAPAPPVDAPFPPALRGPYRDDRHHTFWLRLVYSRMWVREMFVQALRELFDRPEQTAAEVQHLLMLYQARVERHNKAFVWDCEYCSDPETTCGCGDHHRRSRWANSARDAAEQELANLCNALQLCCEKFVYAYFGPNTGVNTANVQQCALDAIDQLLRGHPDAPKACKRTEEAWVTLLGVAKHPRDWLTAFDMKGFRGCPPEDLEQKQAFRDAIARLARPPLWPGSVTTPSSGPTRS